MKMSAEFDTEIKKNYYIYVLTQHAQLTSVSDKNTYKHCIEVYKSFI